MRQPKTPNDGCAETPRRGLTVEYANASAAIYEINGVEYVVYGFGGEPGQSFALGDAVIAFALPSSTTAAAAKAKAK